MSPEQSKAIDDFDWQAEEAELVEILYQHLFTSALTGAQTGLALLGGGIGIDWGLVNEAVRRWARQMSLEQVRGIMETSRRFVTEAIADWIASGQPLDQLSATLTPMFGPVRAEMIAATEVTRAFAQGNAEAWRQSGVVSGWRWQTAADEVVCPICGPRHGQVYSWGDEQPPAHPRCRCWTQPVVGDGD